MSNATPGWGARDLPPAPEIEFRDVHTNWGAYPGPAPTSEMSWGRAEALAGLSLTLPAGQVTVLLGDHGSGKSLLALHLLGEVPLRSGQVLSNGRSVWEMSEAKRLMLHDQVGVLLGGRRIRKSHINPDASVRENLKTQVGRSHIRSTENRDNDDEAVEAWLRNIKLGDVADLLPGELGPAARRRLAVSLALASDPALAVIDDPGEALDYSHVQVLVDGFKRWHGRIGATVLVALRSLMVAKLIADKVAVLRDGRVLVHGSPEEVLDGVIDDETFERRFQTGLGGFSEADPERLANLGLDDTRWGGHYLDIGHPMSRSRRPGRPPTRTKIR
jgi:ABC-type multidrug transport system ATPase subunit